MAGHVATSTLTSFSFYQDALASQDIGFLETLKNPANLFKNNLNNTGNNMKSQIQNNDKNKNNNSNNGGITNTTIFPKKSFS